MLKREAKKELLKKVKKGFKGYPVATVALYGPNDRKATKLVVGIIRHEHGDADQIKKWYSDDDIMKESDVFEEVLNFIQTSGAKSVGMIDKIIGCPHEEGIDYPEGHSCPLCPFWTGRNRWTGRVEH